MAHTARIIDHFSHAEPMSALERSLHRRASREGISLEALREADLRWLRSPSYPTPDCLDPYEVEQFFSTALPTERADHVETCPMCAALVEASMPSNRKFEEFGLLLAKLPEERRSSAAVGSTWKLAKDLCKVELPIVTVLGTFVLWVVLRHDAIMATLLADDARRLVFAAGLTGIIPLLLAGAGAKWLSAYPLFERVGGLALGTVFAGVVGLYCLHINTGLTRSHERIHVAQTVLFETIVEKQKLGQVYADSLYAQKVAAGTLVAVRNGDSFDIYWERKGKRSEVATVYEGTVEREGDGAVMVRPDNPESEIPSMPLPKNEQWKIGKSVTALIQKNGTAPTMVAYTQ